jgi:hypothetical protein
VGLWLVGRFVNLQLTQSVFNLTAIANPKQQCAFDLAKAIQP